MAKPKIIIGGRMQGKAWAHDQIMMMHAMRADGPIKVQTIKTRDTTVEKYTMNTRFEIGTLRFGDNEAMQKIAEAIGLQISGEIKKQRPVVDKDELINSYDID
jgi:cytoskeletal protein CcmA (bactofilin family)